jgi:ABC-type transport system substrate-binding protein
MNWQLNALEYFEAPGLSSLVFHNLYPEGKQGGTPIEDTIQLVVKYLAEVGIKCAYKYTERSLYMEHYDANDRSFEGFALYCGSRKFC